MHILQLRHAGVRVAVVVMAKGTFGKTIFAFSISDKSVSDETITLMLSSVHIRRISLCDALMASVQSAQLKSTLYTFLWPYS